MEHVHKRLPGHRRTLSFRILPVNSCHEKAGFLKSAHWNSVAGCCQYGTRSASGPGQEPHSFLRISPKEAAAARSLPHGNLFPEQDDCPEEGLPSSGISSKLQIPDAAASRITACLTSRQYPWTSAAALSSFIDHYRCSSAAVHPPGGSMELPEYPEPNTDLCSARWSCRGSALFPDRP